MTLYFTAVSNELLPALRSGENMPACLRVKREVGPILAPDPGAWTLVEFEDDEAPPELAGRTVTPTIQATFADHGEMTHTTVMSRDLDTTHWQVVP